MDEISSSFTQTFQQNGFLKIPGFLSSEEVVSLRERAQGIVDHFDSQQVSIFSTQDQTRTSDEYFLQSGDKIRCFFEEEAFDSNGNLSRDKKQSINKIGHALHDLDPVFSQVSYKPALAKVARAIGMKDPIMVQSQYIFKQPQIGGKVAPHQDSTFIYTDPPSCIGFWMALEDATISNGCLMGIPGSHREPLSDRRFVRDNKGGTTFVGGQYPDWDLNRMVSLEVPSGTLIVLHGELVHMSNPNRSEKSRHAYIIHTVEGDRPWPVDNWLQRASQLPFRHLFQ